MNKPMTVPQGAGLEGTVFMGSLCFRSLLATAVWADWGGSWGHNPSAGWQDAPGLGKRPHTQGALLSQMGLAFPTEQDVGLHWGDDRS